MVLIILCEILSLWLAIELNGAGLYAGNILRQLFYPWVRSISIHHHLHSKNWFGCIRSSFSSQQFASIPKSHTTAWSIRDGWLLLAGAVAFPRAFASQFIPSTKSPEWMDRSERLKMNKCGADRWSAILDSRVSSKVLWKCNQNCMHTFVCSVFVSPSHQTIGAQPKWPIAKNGMKWFEIPRKSVNGEPQQSEEYCSAGMGFNENEIACFLWFPSKILCWLFIDFFSLFLCWFAFMQTVIKTLISKLWIEQKKYVFSSSVNLMVEYNWFGRMLLNEIQLLSR